MTVLSQSGYRHGLNLPASSSILLLKRTLLTSWPSGLGEAPAQESQIRLIHAGKILMDSVTIEALGTTAVVHISIRPESAQHDTQDKKTSCCSIS